MVFVATGSLGRHVLDGLVAQEVAPATITAVGRNTARLAELTEAGFTVAALDFSDAASVADLISGHSGTDFDVVLISGSDPDRLAQHRCVITAAKDAGPGTSTTPAPSGPTTNALKSTPTTGPPNKR